MLDKIARDPHGIVESADDDEIARFLLALEVLDKFEARPALAKEWLSVMCIDLLPTHLVVARRFEGMRRVHDNGYVCHAYPRSKFTRAMVEALAMEGIDPQDAARTMPMRWVGSSNGWVPKGGRQ